MLHAVVRNGRLVLDEPTDLPEGEIVNLEPVAPMLVESEDEWNLDAEERARIDAIFEQSKADVAAGRYVDADDWLAMRRAARQPR